MGDATTGDSSQLDYPKVDFLALPGCLTERYDWIEHILLVRAGFDPQIPDKCPTPNCGGAWLSELDSTVEVFWDIPRGSSPVLVELAIPLITCSFCGQTLRIDLPWLHTTRQITYRLEDYILDRLAALSTFGQVALDTGLRSGTVVDLFLAAFRESERAKSKDLPRVLGIDEVYFHGEYYTILVNGETGAVVDLLEGEAKNVIRQRLEQATNREAVEFVTQDFSGPFRDVTTMPPKQSRRRARKVGTKKHSESKAEAADSSTFVTPLFGEIPQGDAYNDDRYAGVSPELLAALLPNAKIVGDHYHFAQKIEECLDDVRKYVQNSLVSYFREEVLRGVPKEDRTAPNFLEEIAQKAKERENQLQDKKFLFFRDPAGLKDTDDRIWFNTMLRDHPLLKKAWQAKNGGLAIFPPKPLMGRSKGARKAAMEKSVRMLLTEQEAGRRLDAWMNSIHSDVRPFFRKAINLIRNWRQEIIRIGTTPYSNAGTEQKNRFLRMLQAISRGLKFEMMRAASSLGRRTWPHQPLAGVRR